MLEMLTVISELQSHSPLGSILTPYAPGGLNTMNRTTNWRGRKRSSSFQRKKRLLSSRKQEELCGGNKI